MQPKHTWNRILQDKNLRHTGVSTKVLRVIFTRPLWWEYSVERRGSIEGCLNAKHLTDFYEVSRIVFRYWHFFQAPMISTCLAFKDWWVSLFVCCQHRKERMSLRRNTFTASFSKAHRENWVTKLHREGYKVNSLRIKYIINKQSSKTHFMPVS